MLRVLLRGPQKACTGGRLQCLASVNPGRQTGWKKSKKKTGNDDSRLPLYELYTRCVEPGPREVEPLSAEELERGAQLAKRYTQMMWKRNKLREQDYQRKIKLKWAAIAALPSEELRAEALLVTDFTVPQHKRIAGWTPPQATATGGRFGEYQVDDEVVKAQNTIDDTLHYMKHVGGDGTF